MMRQILLLTIALATLPAAPSAVAQPGAQRLVSDISILRDDKLLQGDFSPPEYRFINLDTRDWIRPAEMPADLRARLLDLTSFVAVEVDASGRAVGCRILQPSAEPRLDALACALLPVRGTYSVRRIGPGRPVAAARGYRVRWETIDAERYTAPAGPTYPPPLPYVSAGGIQPTVPWDHEWPRMAWTSNLRPHAVPAIQAAYPARPGRPAEGVVGLDLLIDPERGITGCEIGVSSRNPVLDALACEVTRTLVLDYRFACEGLCGGPERLPLQVVWARRGSHIRFPLLPPSLNNPQFRASEEAETPRDPADPRPLRRSPVVRVSPPRGSGAVRPTDASYRNAQADYAFEIGPDGVLRSCRAAQSSGNTGLDAWLCYLLFQRILTVHPTDVFGNPAPTRGTYRYNLDHDRY